MSSWLGRSTVSEMVGKLLPAELAAVAFGRVSRMVAMMSERSFLVNESVLQHLLEVRLEDADAVEGIFFLSSTLKS